MKNESIPFLERIYPAFDLLFSISIAIATCWIVAKLLPGEWPMPVLMITGMLTGMVIGNLIGLFIFTIPLGMFEAMYIGGFSGMFAGMIGAMTGASRLPLMSLLLASAIGTSVWLGHFLLNRYYRKERPS